MDSCVPLMGFGGSWGAFGGLQRVHGRPWMGFGGILGGFWGAPKGS